MVSVDQCYDVISVSGITFNITHCQNVTVHFQTHASFNMKQDTKQKSNECIVTSIANITFDITDCNKISQQWTNFVRYICIMFTQCSKVPVFGHCILQYMIYSSIYFFVRT